YDSVVVESNGEILLYNGLDSANFFYQADTFPVFIGFGDFMSQTGTGDLRYRTTGASPISYELTGLPGARIAKFEWKNCGFYDDTTSTEFINFQIWIYEITGDVEYRFGTSSVTPYSYGGSPGPVIGIAPYVADPDYIFLPGIFLQGDSTTCTSVSTYTNTTGTPVLNAVHRFANLATSGIKENATPVFSIYPNPANGKVNMVLPQGNQLITFTDISGRICLSENNTGGNLSISLEGLQAGVYLITVSNEARSSTQRLVVQ
ncbi:MAG: T9SS type A sorting domain-containing protein, partial [Bacteroidota bacterium]|nr:T9SS type A sorting domain-containing protein [Bacteroidota bacterium]